MKANEDDILTLDRIYHDLKKMSSMLPQLVNHVKHLTEEMENVLAKIEVVKNNNSKDA
jgi:uncharacterized spore protein YtfJ